MENPRQVLTPEAMQCCLCPMPHRLWRHGKYKRWAIEPNAKDTRIEVCRLYCWRQKRTVSLLPDFCIPRRQHGPAVLAVFLLAWLFEGMSLLGALRKARPAAPCHAVAQSLLRGFMGRMERVADYLARVTPKAPDLPELPRRKWRQLAQRVLWLGKGWKDPAAAFVHHGRGFHAQSGLGLC